MSITIRDNPDFRRLMKRLKAEASTAIGHSLHTKGVFICGRLPWAEEQYRPWGDADEADAVNWARQFFRVGPRTVRLAVLRISLDNRFWPDGIDPPIVTARLQPNPDGSWHWFVRCPYCGKQHSHGGHLEGDPRRFLAHHTERCEKPVKGACGYRLVEEKRAGEKLRHRAPQRA